MFDNIKWFSDKNRLNDISPYYFPEKQTIILNGKNVKVSPMFLENKIFMIGLTGVGTIDLNPMPFEQSCPMVALHANAINLLLTRQALEFTPEWYKWAMPLILAMLIGIFSARFTAMKSLIITLIVNVIYAGIVWSLWVKNGLWLTYVIPFIAINISYLILIVYKFIQSSRDRQKIRNIFSTMVSPTVLKVMEENPNLFSLSGERKPGTTAFSMINGFINVTQTVAPDYLSKILSHYLTPCSEIIMDYDGYIDKYEGHIIMADFGVPLDDPGNAWKCAYAGVEQLLDIKAFQYYIFVDYGVKIKTTMGFNFGYVSAGNMGSDKKMQYTVMGDAVNVAARFMPANIIYNTNIITGGATYYQIKDYAELRKLDKLLLKGKTIPTAIFEMMGWNKEKYLELLGQKPVPESQLTRWKFAPGGKIFGYHKFWLDKNQDIKNSMIEEFVKFFESQLMTATDMIEYSNKIFLFELFDEIERTKKKYDMGGIDLKGGSYDNILTNYCHKLVQPILEKLISDPSKLEEFHTLQLLENKINLFKNKIELTGNIDEIILLVFERLKKFIETENRTETIASINLKLNESTAKYQSAVQILFDKVSAKPLDYRTMMAEVGSLTSKRREVRDLYEESIEKYWNREWDAAIAGFEKCLAIVPDDQPSLCLLERTKIYKQSPPAANWQGEFVQTKK